MQVIMDCYLVAARCKKKDYHDSWKFHSSIILLLISAVIVKSVCLFIYLFIPTLYKNHFKLAVLIIGTNIPRLPDITKGLRFEKILWNDQMNREWT